LSTAGTLTVAVHDVEPRSFARVKEIRAWLYEHGVSRVTLLVIPAADLHPIGDRAPILAAWLREQVGAGDTVAQHGLAHKANGRPPFPRSVVARWQGGPAAEFPGLDKDDTARRVDMGLRLLREIHLDPRGFVAPGYAYTRALRSVLAENFDWFADTRRVRSRQTDLKSTALCLGSSTAVKRRFSPGIVRTLARRPGAVMRLDVHPADFDLPGHVATLEHLLEHANGRDVVTYDELVP
jgi:predicted deacetylase